MKIFKYYLILFFTIFNSSLLLAQTNVVVIFADDLGYNDLSSYGAPLIQTPNLDAMASNGIRLTNFYVPHSVCTPSRVALLTGRYAPRTNLFKVIFPNANGLGAEEVTIAEAVKNVGYTTACVGKWHLGDKPQDLPRTQGFDYYYGIPYSNDMDMSSQIPLAADIVLREGITLQEVQNGDYNHPKSGGDFPPLMQNEEAIEFPADQSTLTQRYTTEALNFIETAHNNNEPFFLYMPHTFPHVPLFRSPDFENVSAEGIYGDVVEEMDWSVGQILQKLDDLSISNNTLVIFTSDNGPWLSKGSNAGNADPLRGGKFDVYDGGVREPFIAQWPGQIPAGTVSSEPAMSIDLFPTILNLAGAQDFIPTDVTIDGRDILPVLNNTGARNWDQLFFYQANQTTLKALRCGDFKAHFNNQLTQVNELYDLSADIGESNNLVNTNTTVRDEMLAKGQAFKRQDNDVALWGVSALSYFGQRNGGVELTTLEVNRPYLADNTNAFVQTVPTAFENSVLVQYGSGDQNFADEEFIILSTVVDGELMVAYDAQATQLPTWLSTWTATTETMTASVDGQSYTFDLYTKTFTAGDILILGGNTEGGGDGAVPYIAAAVVPPTSAPPGVQAPYNGQPFAIPGIIQAEEYDLGGAGIAYNDTDASNNGGEFRPDEGVDINVTQDIGGGFHVGWTDPGEWIEYTVDVATAGVYDIDLRVGCPTSGEKCHLEFNSVNVTGSIDLPNTGGYQNWETVTVKNVSLQAGQQIMRFVSETDNFNVNYFEVKASVAEPGDILFRVNAGGAAITATDGTGIDWSADQAGSPSPYVNATETGNVTNSAPDPITADGSLPAYVPLDIFTIERFSSSDNDPVVPLEWDFPVANNGQFKVNLFFVEAFRNDANRTFDVFVEDELKLDNYSMYAEVGGDVALVKSFVTEVTDGNLDIDLVPDNLLPKIDGIEIIYLGPTTPPADLTLSLTLEGAPNINGDYIIELADPDNTAIPLYTFTPSITSGSTIPLTGIFPGDYQVSVTRENYLPGTATTTLVSGANTLDLGELQLDDEDVVLYRVNVGSTMLAATDNPKPDWSADTEGNPSPYVNAAETSNNTSFTNNSITLDPSVPTYVPLNLLQTDRYSSNPGDPIIVPMEWDFPVQEEGEYIINLLFAEIFRTDNQRRFDINIEGVTVLPDYCIHEEVGHDVGVMKTFTVQVTDGNIDIDLVSTGLLPKINGIEILKVNTVIPPEDADLTISLSLEGRSNIDGNYTVELYESGNTTTPAFTFAPTVSQASSIELTGLNAGTYDVLVKHEHFLQKIQSVTLVTGANTMDVGALKAGDANNDNKVSSLDFSILAASFNLMQGETGYDATADFNGDGMVTSLDFSLLAGNFNESGDTFGEP